MSLFLTLFNHQGCSFKCLHVLIKEIMKYIWMYMILGGNFHLQSGMAVFMNAKNIITWDCKVLFDLSLQCIFKKLIMYLNIKRPLSGKIFKYGSCYLIFLLLCNKISTVYHHNSIHELVLLGKIGNDYQLLQFTNRLLGTNHDGIFTILFKYILAV